MIPIAFGWGVGTLLSHEPPLLGAMLFSAVLGDIGRFLPRRRIYPVRMLSGMKAAGVYITIGSSCFAPSTCDVPTDSHGREVTPTRLMWEAKEWYGLVTPEGETNRREISVTNDSWSISPTDTTVIHILQIPLALKLDDFHMKYHILFPFSFFIPLPPLQAHRLQ